MDDLERQLHTYWSDVTDDYPEPDVGPMLGVLQLEPEPPTSDDYWGETITLDTPLDDRPKPHWIVAVAAVALLVVAFSGMYVVSRTIGLSPGAAVDTPNIVPQDFYSATGPFLAGGHVSGDGADEHSYPGPRKPDVTGATPGDDGDRPLPLGSVTELSDRVRPNAALGCAQVSPCSNLGVYKIVGDAQFSQSDDPNREVDPITSRQPFYIRPGFINETGIPLGAGFDVALYVTEEDQPTKFGGVTRGDTTRYTSDYVTTGQTNRCGPNFETQTGPVTCESYVHEFPDGLPEGDFVVWAVWEAPCSAWIDLGYTNFCADPDEVVSFFAAGGELNIEAGGSSAVDDERLIVSLNYRYQDGPEVDASGSAASGGTPLPDIEGAILDDSFSRQLPGGSATGLPGADYLDFLFELCEPELCFRDAHFVQPDNPGVGSGPYESGRPFYVREGFVNDTDEGLPEGFDVSLYVFEMDWDLGLASTTTKYAADYTLRGETDRCGPGYNDQTGSVACEWFVFEFLEGLPEGRFALWAVWNAPCSAWIDLGFTESCEDPNEVTSFFSSGVDSPFGPFPPEYDEPRPLR